MFPSNLNALSTFFKVCDLLYHQVIVRHCNHLDILEQFVIECKRRRKIAVYEFMKQAEASCKEGQTPIVVMRADGEKSLALVRWEDMLKFLGNELPPAQPEVHPSPKDGD